MTRRERLERKLEKREEWAGKATARSNAAYESTRRIVDGIPLGQPILVGHHSEKRHRRDIDRMARGMDKSVAESKLASHHGSKAVGLSHQLERSIFSDDEDATQKLEEKAKACDEAAAQCNAINRAWRKGGRGEVAAQFGEKLAAASEKLCSQFSWLQRKGPMDASHDRAEARRCRERIKLIAAQQTGQKAAEAAGGVTLKKYVEQNWCVVTFAEKPDRSVLEALRAAGYRWGAGSWQGRLEALPSKVAELSPSEDGAASEAAQ